MKGLYDESEEPEITHLDSEIKSVNLTTIWSIQQLIEVLALNLHGCLNEFKCSLKFSDE